MPWSCCVSPRSTSPRSMCLCFGCGWPSHWSTSASLPWPNCLLARARLVPCVADVGAGWLPSAAWVDRRRAGSPWCRGQACHCRPHMHVHCLVSRDLWQSLHQTLWSSLCRSKAAFVPSTCLGHLGHWKKICCGMLLARLLLLACCVFAELLAANCEKPASACPTPWVSSTRPAPTVAIASVARLVVGACSGSGLARL